MFSRMFFIATAERSIKTVAQTAAALLVGNGVGLLNADWVSVLSVAGMAGVVSVLTSIGSATVGNDGPSLAGEDLER
jgi:glyoxylate carboligase